MGNGSCVRGSAVETPGSSPPAKEEEHKTQLSRQRRCIRSAVCSSTGLYVAFKHVGELGIIATRFQLAARSPDAPPMRTHQLLATCTDRLDLHLTGGSPVSVS